MSNTIRALLVGGPSGGEVVDIAAACRTLLIPWMGDFPPVVGHAGPMALAATLTTGKLTYERTNQVVGEMVIFKHMSTEKPTMHCGYCYESHDAEELAKCAERMVALGKSEPFWTPEYIEGYRGFSITEVNGKFQLKGVQRVWGAADVGPAECISLLKNERRDHPAPQAACRCGYYAFKDYADTQIWEVDAKVLLWGEIIEHAKGYRAEHARIVALRPGRAVYQLTAPTLPTIIRSIAKDIGVDYEWQT